ncbi:MAG: N-acetylmuramoyl-L-alanine amidase [Saprospiraceae bacterium]|nr:N-acetylmuramoyl-L-alanine amidase [Saprospiraceae bacterium]
MMKAIFVLQTILILSLPMQLQGFNLLLSFPASHCSEPPTETLDFQTAKLGKFIKLTRLQEKDYQIKTVVIDPGHGGHDPGCLGGHSREKHLALGIAQQLAKMMRQTFPDIRVILTRDSDVFIPLHERAAIANRNNADLFISIHCNFMPGLSRVNGSETYVMGLHTAEHNLNVAKRENSAILLEDNYEKNYDYDPNSPEGHILLSMFQNAYLEQSILFAEKVEEKFAAEAGRKSRGVKQAGFVVLKETTMPSVLVEAGFLSNRREEQFLKSKRGQQIMANAILLAFAEYKYQLEGGDIASFQVKSPELTAPPSLQTVSQRRVEIQSRKAQPAQYSSPTPTPRPTSTDERPLVPDLPAQPAYQAPNIQTESKMISFGQEAEPEKTKPKSYNYTPREKQALEETFSIQNIKNIQFHVQLAASPSPINTRVPKWRNLGYMVEMVTEDNMYKYQARNFSSLEQAEQARLLLKSKGFTDAFIVSYKDGKRIPIEQAKSELGIR